MKCWLLDKTWLLKPRTHSSSGYMHKTYTRSSSHIPSIDEVDDLQVPPFTEELKVKSHSLLKTGPLLAFYALVEGPMPMLQH